MTPLCVRMCFHFKCSRTTRYSFAMELHLYQLLNHFKWSPKILTTFFHSFKLLVSHPWKFICFCAQRWANFWNAVTIRMLYLNHHKYVAAAFSGNTCYLCCCSFCCCCYCVLKTGVELSIRKIIILRKNDMRRIESRQRWKSTKNTKYMTIFCKVIFSQNDSRCQQNRWEEHFCLT